MSIFYSDQSNLNNKKIGFLLMNIGTPSAPTVKGIRTYLREFLSDPDVIDTNFILRWIIVNLFVVPFRPKKILPQYQSIWTKDGSPLLAYSRSFVEKISKKNPTFKFEIGMRYGEPSIEEGLIKLKEANVDKIVLIPMFPQYAQATSGSCIKKALAIIKKLNIRTPYEINYSFYEEEFFINCLTSSIENSDPYKRGSLLLFSFHGLPERHIRKLDKSKQYCLKDPGCCEKLSEYNQMCYKYHCHYTVAKVVEKLQTKKPYKICFQSRFGFDSWIKPNTTDVIESLPSKGIKDVAVVCPAFVFDCLETLEEIAIRNNEYFLDSGGTNLKLIPALNDKDEWVDTFYDFIYKKFA